MGFGIILIGINAKNRPRAKIKELQKLENGNVATTKEIRTIFY